MSDLINLTNVSLAFGLEPLLEKVNLQIASGERVCLIGRNGAGKSSLLKIIDGTQLPDSGVVWRKSHLRLARLEQELPQQITLTVYEYVASGLPEEGKLLAAYHTLIQNLTADNLNQLERLQQEMDAKNAWHFENTIQNVLTRLELDPEKKVAELSGGWQRRAALAKALVSNPELLLLDEPTNHLDISAIQWLEEQLLLSNVGLLFITHDRSLLQRLATRIIELDRGQLTSWPGDYANFLRHKEELLHAEARLNAEFDKKLAQEERWIRQGIKARRTRNEGRVRALKKMRVERSERRELQAGPDFSVSAATKSGQLVAEMKNVTQGYDDKCLIKDFSLRIMRGDRMGLVGPNGVGKSTFLNILLGKVTPQQGTVTQGTNLQIRYFDQLRQILDLEKSVAENVAEGSDTIEINGKKRHIISYLGDFLFAPQRALTPVKALSGGECNRLVLAKLFSQPANLLVLDEPTNDLDIETLELLEELLANYDGTLLLVSHDRNFLDNVVTSILAFEGAGHIQEYIGGYQDYLQQSKVIMPVKTVTTPASAPVKEQAKPNKKLTYNEQKELAALPQKIQQLEAEQVQLQALASSAELYQQGHDAINKTMLRIKELEQELLQTYQRWEKLEDKS